MSIPMPSVSRHDPSNRLITTEGKALPLEGAELRVDARGGLARVVLVQRFRNPHDEPLRVTYKLPLPADAAVSGFVFHVGERTIRGVVEGRSDARQKFEQAILEGKSAALLEEDRSSLFTQEIGNVPPHTSVVAEIEIDQPLAWLVEGSWEWRFPLAAAPRYLGAGPLEGDVALDVASGDVGARASLELTVRDDVPEKRSPESPSHALECVRARSGFDVKLGSGNEAPLDRDVVVRWPVATLEPGASIDVARPASAAGEGRAYGLFTLVPPSPGAGAAATTRDVSLLLDTSGSMSGEPLEQMKRIACALVDSLGDGDTLEMIEFSTRPRAFTRSPEQVTGALKKKAWSWIGALQASGGTEMVTGVKESLRELRAGSQRQVVMITDGLVGFERDVVKSILDGLPASARFHAVGVGSSVNRSLLLPVARAGRGVEAIVGLGEDAERAAKRVLSRTAAPVVVDLTIEGSALKRTASERSPDCFAGAPARVALELDPKGGELVVRGRIGGMPFERRLTVPATERGAGSESVAKLFARERVEDVEMRLTAGVGTGHDKEIEEIGKTFSIATRLTSFIAVSDESTVDPRAPSRRETQPQALPYGMSAEGLGLRSSAPPAPRAMALGRATAMRPAPMRAAAGPLPPGGFGAPPPPASAPPSPAAMPRRMASMAIAREEGRPAEDTAKKKGAVRAQHAKPESAAFGFDESERDTEAPRAAQGAAREIVARIATRSDLGLTLELVVPEPGLEFELEGARATVRLADGRVVDAHVFADRSTHAGSYAGGVVLRIALELVAGRASDVDEAVVHLASGVTIRARA